MYLSSYVFNKKFWIQWSRAGVIKASEILGVSEKTVPRTNNHLESHNNLLKGDCFVAHQHGGQLPRVDVWILVLITEVIPDIFFWRANQQVLQAQRAYLRTACGSRPELSVPTPDSPPDSPPAADLVLELDSIACDSTSESGLFEVNSISDAEDSWLALPKHALDTSQIAPDLELPDTATTESHDSSPPSSPGSVPPSTVNSHAILMQELLISTDACLDLVRRLQALGVSYNELTPYISPYNAAILGDLSGSSGASTAFLPMPSPLPTSPDSSPSDQEYQDQQSSGHLVAFERQRKEPRKQSYAQW
ncbi:hypothetical protein C8Q80DRAFT_1275377 [Daedaleopsis nitida]|nr:hypothetical protein C8Q80DRAFT_1275377 [Daedaleopsis nitida]